ncbi:MAG: class I SAM-dependent methyltransferase, partial [Spirochaetes bacterium]|nr:class I SAM-dependent methyltransferase [Spirochaetota bacterium]
MDFYTNISNYYDHIFPFDIEQFDFIKSFIIIKKKQNILETGCGTGHLSVKLAEIGLNVHAIDSDQEMINMAEKNKKINFKYPIFKKMDMRSIKYKFSHDFFDLIFCFGNTLPHLTDKEDISAFIKSSHVLLKKKGILLIQVLNYEYILNKNINKLPLIENDEIIF